MLVTRSKVLTTRFKVLTMWSKVLTTSQLFVISPNLNHHSEGSDTFTGNQLRDSFFWLLPPNLSTNHNIVCKAHHNGTAQWFFQGSIFNQWKSAGSLCIYGKHVLLLTFAI